MCLSVLGVIVGIPCSRLGVLVYDLIGVNPYPTQTRNTLMNEIDGLLEIECCTQIQRPNVMTPNKLVKFFVEF